MAADDPRHWSHKKSPALGDIIIENNELRGVIERFQGALGMLENLNHDLDSWLQRILDMALMDAETLKNFPVLASLIKEYESWQSPD